MKQLGLYGSRTLVLFVARRAGRSVAGRMPIQMDRFFAALLAATMTATRSFGRRSPKRNGVASARCPNRAYGNKSPSFASASFRKNSSGLGRAKVPRTGTGTFSFA
jgi:hypothetical protein